MVQDIFQESTVITGHNDVKLCLNMRRETRRVFVKIHTQGAKKVKKKK